MAWGKTKRDDDGNLHAVGTGCKVCLSATKAAYKTMTWTQVVQRAAVDSAFRDEVAKVVHTLHGSRTKNFCPQEVLGETAVGYRMVAKLLFMSSSEFKQLEGVTPESLGLKEVHLNDELGHPVAGLILKDPSHPHRSLEIFSGIQSLVAEQLLDGKDMLRRDQGIEMHEWQKTEVEKKLPKPMKVPSEAWTFDGLRAFVDKKKEEVEQARIQQDNERASLAPLAALVAVVAQPPAAPLQGLSPGKDDESDSDPGTGLLNFSVGNTKLGGRGGKGKGKKSKGKGRQAEPKPKKGDRYAQARALLGSPRRRRDAPATPAVTVAMATSRPSASIPDPVPPRPVSGGGVAVASALRPSLPASSSAVQPMPSIERADREVEAPGPSAGVLPGDGEGSSSRKRPSSEGASIKVKKQAMSERSTSARNQDDPVGNAKKWREALKLDAILSGQNPGQDVYQSRRALQRLEVVDPYHQEVLLIKAQIDLAKKAAAMQSPSSLQREQREAHIQALQDHGVNWPVALQASILALAFKESIKEFSCSS